MSRDRVIQLQECAEELGFSTITEALDAGYHEVQDLVAGTFKLEKIDDMVEQEKAHEAWLEEKENLLYLLKEFAVQFEGTLVHRHKEFFDLYRRLEKFIKEAHD